jgi:hypothetical protein
MCGTNCRGEVLIPHVCCCRGNTCLCGSVPSWLAPRANTNSTSLGSNCTSTFPGCVPAGGYDMEWYQDVSSLLPLVQAATSQSRFATWDPSTGPPCWNSVDGPAGPGDCSVCGSYRSDAACGGPNPAGGLPLCGWKYVSCRNKRVVGLVFDQRVSGRGVTCQDVIQCCVGLWQVHLLVSCDSLCRVHVSWSLCCVVRTCSACTNYTPPPQQLRADMQYMSQAGITVTSLPELLSNATTLLEV